MSRLSIVQQQQSSEFHLEDGRRLRMGAPIGATGSASSVYRAVIESPTGLRKKIAVKVFGAIASDDAENVSTAIAQAAQRSAHIDHSNVVRTYDYLIYNGQPLLVLELVDGVNLETLIEHHRERRRRVPLDLAVFIALEVGEGLSGARDARDDEGMQLGLVHHGLTPREILLSWRGEVKVEGFGLDVARAGTSSIRTLRGVGGRAHMMSPEVASGLPADARADVFSLGMLLREMLVGPRFARGLKSAEGVRLAREGYIQPNTFAPDLPAELAQTINRAIAVEAEDRYPNSTAMLVDLRRIAFSLGVGDLRYFLRRALDRELRDGANEDTQEVFLTEAQDDRD